MMSRVTEAFSVLISTLQSIRKPLSGGGGEALRKLSTARETGVFEGCPWEMAQEHSKIVHSQQIPYFSRNVGGPWDAISAICRRFD